MPQTRRFAAASLVALIILADAALSATAASGEVRYLPQWAPHEEARRPLRSSTPCQCSSDDATTRRTSCIVNSTYCRYSFDAQSKFNGTITVINSGMLELVCEGNHACAGAAVTSTGSPTFVSTRCVGDFACSETSFLVGGAGFFSVVGWNTGYAMNVDMTGPNARSTVFCAGAGCGLLGDATSSSAISEVICDTAGDCSWFPNSLKGGWCCRGPGCSSMSMPTCL